MTTRMTPEDLAIWRKLKLVRQSYLLDSIGFQQRAKWAYAHIRDESTMNRLVRRGGGQGGPFSCQ